MTAASHPEISAHVGSINVGISRPHSWIFICTTPDHYDNGILPETGKPMHILHFTVDEAQDVCRLLQREIAKAENREQGDTHEPLCGP